jgi:hypothetical protein
MSRARRRGVLAGFLAAPVDLLAVGAPVIAGG